MTVFNHFFLKEDLFFDLDEGGREDLLAPSSKENLGRLPPKHCGCSPTGLLPINVPTSASLKKAAISSSLQFRQAKLSKPGPERSAVN